VYRSYVRLQPISGDMTKSRSAILSVILCVVALAATASLATPASGATRATTIRAKRAQVAKAESLMAASRSELATALAGYEEAGAELDVARTDLESTNATIRQLETEITARQALLDERVATMYKSGGFEVLQALLSVETLDDLFSRMDMLSYIQDSDSQLLDGLAAARRQADFLRQQQAQRETELIALRQQADARMAVVKVAIAQQQTLVRSLGAEITRLVKEQEAAEAAAAAEAALNDGTPSPPVPFKPNTIISDGNYLDAASLTVDGIQAFLGKQSGRLDTYTGTDHNGVTKSAAEMIADAAAAWGVSPKVILVTLQKEQSLISRSDLTQYALDWAMGCGKMDSRTLPEYQGFGNQIWGGARALKRNRSSWRAGISLSIDGTAVYPSNASTHSLYRYTPHFHGNTSFWKLYWRYFGDPLK
jgi:peptidoglycan hydrolase CwlO-like protein